MNLIAAVDKNWGIGKNGNLLEHIPEDMSYFKEKTTGQVVVMGRATFESLPGKKALPNRINVVLSRDENFFAEDVLVFRDVTDFLRDASGKWTDKEIFFVGGESVYQIGVDLCDTAYVTKIEKSYDADRFFPNLDKMVDWEIKVEEKLISSKGIALNFVVYKKKN